MTILEMNHVSKAFGGSRARGRSYLVFAFIRHRSSRWRTTRTGFGRCGPQSGRCPTHRDGTRAFRPLSTHSKRGPSRPWARPHRPDATRRPLKQ